MNIEKFSNNQELTEQDCTNVYGGTISRLDLSMPVYHALPSDPYKPRIPPKPGLSTNISPN